MSAPITSTASVPYPNSVTKPRLPLDSPPLSSASSVSSSASESEHNIFAENLQSALRKTRAERPRMVDRQKSSSIVVPKGTDTYQRVKPEYPPGDARAMSPRRDSADLEKLGLGARKSLQDQARTLQSSLAELASRIDEVRADHDRLENENRLLQDYIGGLTRSMSKENLGRSTSTRKSKR